MTNEDSNSENGLGSMPTIFLYVYSVQLLLSLVFNTVVLYCATRRREEYLRNYGMLLSHTAVVCMRSSLTFWFSEMVIHLRPRAAIITTKGPLLLLFDHSEIAFTLFRIVFSDFPGLICVMAFSYSLEVFYRYLAALYPKFLLQFFAPKRTLLLLIPVYCLELSVFILGYSAVTLDQVALSNYFPIGNGHVDVDSVFIGTFFAESPAYIIACTISCIISVSSIIFVFYCSTKVSVQLKKRENILYSRTINAQKHLVFALRIQTVLPILFIVPQFIVTLMTMVTTTSPLLEYFAFHLIGWFPVLDPMITIYFVKPFRKTFLRVFCFNYERTTRTRLVVSSPKRKGDTTSSNQVRNL